MKIEYAAFSDIGRVRRHNEDALLIRELEQGGHLLVVADGMGGHQAGEVASRLAVEVFERQYLNERAAGVDVGISMQAGVLAANRAILERAEREPDKGGMGATFTAVVLWGMRLFLVHVGDSRCYLLRKNEMRQLSQDHTFVAKMLEQNRISPDEAAHHPQKNILYMALGTREPLHPQVLGPLPVCLDDRVLLCSDGLSTPVKESVLSGLMVRHSPSRAVREMIRLANRAGGHDNITAILARVLADGAFDDTMILLPAERTRSSFWRRWQGRH